MIRLIIIHNINTVQRRGHWTSMGVEWNHRGVFYLVLLVISGYIWTGTRESASDQSWPRSVTWSANVSIQQIALNNGNSKIIIIMTSYDSFQKLYTLPLWAHLSGHHNGIAFTRSIVKTELYCTVLILDRLLLLLQRQHGLWSSRHILLGGCMD